MDVVDESTVRTLHFGTLARQSTMFLADHQALALSYTRCMMTALLFVEAPRTALLLGLGGGSLAKFLLHHFPDCRIDAVEKRAQVVELARAFFYLPDTPRLQVHIQDATTFLKGQPTGTYDLVLVDIHDCDGMSSAVNQPGFFAACQQCLGPGGAFAINLWSGERGEVLREIMDSLRVTFADQVLRLPVARKSNCIALGLNVPLSPDGMDRWRSRAIELEAQLHLEFPQLLRDLEHVNPHLLR